MEARRGRGKKSGAGGERRLALLTLTLALLTLTLVLLTLVPITLTSSPSVCRSRTNSLERRQGVPRRQVSVICASTTRNPNLPYSPPPNPNRLHVPASAVRALRTLLLERAYFVGLTGSIRCLLHLPPDP